jgi:hypothetical protein
VYYYVIVPLSLSKISGIYTVQFLLLLGFAYYINNIFTGTMHLQPILVSEAKDT